MKSAIDRTKGEDDSPTGCTAAFGLTTGASSRQVRANVPTVRTSPGEIGEEASPDESTFWDEMVEHIEQRRAATVDPEEASFFNRPLSEHELVEWLGTLPSSLKVRGQEGKFLLKKAMEPKLPAEILYRPKMGFSVPLARWFRGPLKQRVRDAVLGTRLADTGWFNRDYLQHLVDAHQAGTRDYSAPLWTLLMFEAFLRNVVEVPGGSSSRQAQRAPAEQPA